jgi:GTPase SAR1 family protein
MVVILVGNKCDLGDESRQVEKEEGKEFAEKEGLCFMETSALNNVNVEQVFLQMITNIHDITNHKTLDAKIDDTPINLFNANQIHFPNHDELTATKKPPPTCCSSS